VALVLEHIRQAESIASTIKDGQDQFLQKPYSIMFDCATRRGGAHVFSGLVGCFLDKSIPVAGRGVFIVRADRREGKS
jgi:hypothetical protein